MSQDDPTAEQPHAAATADGRRRSAPAPRPAPPRSARSSPTTDARRAEEEAARGARRGRGRRRRARRSSPARSARRANAPSRPREEALRAREQAEQAARERERAAAERRSASGSRRQRRRSASRLEPSRAPPPPPPEPGRVTAASGRSTEVLAGAAFAGAFLVGPDPQADLRLSHGQTDNQTSDLAQAIQEVSERASLLIREEIELAKAEMTEKVTKLISGAVVGLVAGIFAVFGLIYLLHAPRVAASGMRSAARRDFWLGFLIVAVLLFIFGALAGFLAARCFKRGVAADAGDGDRGGQADQGDASPASRPAQTSPAIRTDAGGRPLMPAAHAGGDPALDRGQPRRARPRGREGARRGRRGHRLAPAAPHAQEAGGHRRRGRRLRARRRDRRGDRDADRPPLQPAP